MSMASRIDLACQFKDFNVSETKVTEKPPVPTRPLSGKFHNRGNLFPSTQHNKLFQPWAETNKNRKTEKNTCREVELHQSAVKNDCDPNTLKTVPSYCRKTQSAKACQRDKRGGSVSRSNRPCSAEDISRLKRKSNSSKSWNEISWDSDKQIAVVDLVDNITPDLVDIQKEKLLALPAPENYSKTFLDMAPMSFSRPSSAHYDQKQNKECVCKSNNLPDDVEKLLKPSIYGLQKQRQVFGSAPDLSCDTSESFPYKVSQIKDREVRFFSKEEFLNDKIRNLPETLQPLSSWLTNSISQEVIGVDPIKCLVFLPNMDYSSLPEVPEPHTCEDDLPYFRDVTTPKPWNPKKYPHPFNKQPVEEWVCKHSSHTATEEENLHWTTVYKTLNLPQMRTADVIKKEISDLENLLKGIGTQESDCAMVRYQDDLTTLQDMLQVTMDKIPDRLKMAAPEAPDRFGMNKVFKDHDSIIEEIRAKVEDCRLELADLEVEAGIEPERQYFRKRSNSAL